MKSHLAPLAALLFVAAAAAAPPPTRPSPDLDPAQTVDAMLAALKKNTDAGIAELFAFSSPRNAEATGPLARFTQMIRENFPELLAHRAARQAPALIDGARAKIAVEVQDRDGGVHHYGFLLSRQEVPGCDGCWMDDAVVDLDEPDGDEDDEDEAPGQQGA